MYAAVNPINRFDIVPYSVYQDAARTSQMGSGILALVTLVAFAIFYALHSSTPFLAAANYPAFVTFGMVGGIAFTAFIISSCVRFMYRPSRVNLPPPQAREDVRIEEAPPQAPIENPESEGDEEASVSVADAPEPLLEESYEEEVPPSPVTIEIPESASDDEASDSVSDTPETLSEKSHEVGSNSTDDPSPTEEEGPLLTLEILRTFIPPFVDRIEGLLGAYVKAYFRMNKSWFTNLSDFHKAIASAKSVVIPFFTDTSNLFKMFNLNNLNEYLSFEKIEIHLEKSDAAFFSTLPKMLKSPLPSFLTDDPDVEEDDKGILDLIQKTLAIDFRKIIECGLIKFHFARITRKEALANYPELTQKLAALRSSYQACPQDGLASKQMQQHLETYQRVQNEFCDALNQLFPYTLEQFEADIKKFIAAPLSIGTAAEEREVLSLLFVNMQNPKLEKNSGKISFATSVASRQLIYFALNVGLKKTGLPAPIQNSIMGVTKEILSVLVKPFRNGHCKPKHPFFQAIKEWIAIPEKNREKPADDMTEESEDDFEPVHLLPPPFKEAEIENPSWESFLTRYLNYLDFLTTQINRMGVKGK